MADSNRNQTYQVLEAIGIVTLD